MNEQDRVGIVVLQVAGDNARMWGQHFNNERLLRLGDALAEEAERIKQDLEGRNDDAAPLRGAGERGVDLEGGDDRAVPGVQAPVQGEAPSPRGTSFPEFEACVKRAIDRLGYAGLHFDLLHHAGQHQVLALANAEWKATHEGKSWFAEEGL
jgi:hypothetical protein